MTQQTIGIGAKANDGTGDPLRTAYTKVNSNFTELYSDTSYTNLFFVNTATDPHNADVGLRAATFQFQGYDGSPQFHVETSALAVNYVTIRGGIAGSMPVIVAAGSDTNVPLSFAAQALAGVYIGNGAGTHALFDDLGNGGARNWLVFSGNIDGSPPQVSVSGFDDTNIDLAFVPLGTGLVKFGTHTSATSALTADMTQLPSTGSVSIKDAAGTTRKLMVHS